MGHPWFKLYATDYIADSKVRMLTRVQRSMLLDLWCYCAQDGSIPSDPGDLCLLLGESYGDVVEALPRLLPFFQEVGGRLISPRLKAEASAYEDKCQKLKANASKGGANTQANARAKVQAKSTEPEPEPEPEKTKEQECRVQAPSAPPLVTKKRKTRQQKIQPFSEEVKTVVNPLLDIWPQMGTNGESTGHIDVAVFAQRVSDLVEQGEDPSILLEAGRQYCTTPRPKFSAPQYFFGHTAYGGKGDAPWVGYVKLILTKKQQVAS